MVGRNYRGYDPACNGFFTKKELTQEEKMKDIEMILVHNFGVPHDFLRNKIRNSLYVHSRFVYFYLVCEKHKLIGVYNLCKQIAFDHTTILYGKNKTIEYIEGRTRNKTFDKHFSKFDKILL